MYFKLAFRNVKRQMSNYLIYFITVSFTIALMFALNNAIYSDVIEKQMETNPNLKGSLIAISVFIAIVVAFILGYATSFMLKLRKREFGMYLVLGMSRNNILMIFLSEIIVMCIFGMICGMFLGIFIYQGVMAVICNLMEMNFGGSSYSLEGIRFTFFMVIGTFLLASFTSALYLKKTSIYKLIHGDKVVSKGVKHPFLWATVVVISAAALIYSVYEIYKCFLVALQGNGGMNIMLYMLICIVTVISLHVALAKSLVYILMKNKKRSNKGTNRFVLRQLSSKLSADSVLMGIIAFLITFSIVSANISICENIMTEASINEDFQFDMSTDHVLGEEEHYSLDEAENILCNYTGISDKTAFKTYTDGKISIADSLQYTSDYYSNKLNRYISITEFNKLLEMAGRRTIDLKDNEFAINENHAIINSNYNGKKLDINGRKFSYCGDVQTLSIFTDTEFIIIVPDEVCANMKEYSNGRVYNFTSDKFDADELYNDLSYEEVEDGYSYLSSEFQIKEYAKSAMKSATATMILCMMYISLVFVLLAMAILALKTLSGISDDVKKYDILYKLGTDDKERSKALFKQTFTFFFLPYIIPILSSIPVAILISCITRDVGYTGYVNSVIRCTVIIAVVLSAVYVLYYFATYFAAKKNVILKKAIKTL